MSESNPARIGACDPAIGFARLARRTSDWATKTLLTAVILAAGLAFGGQVLKWWASDGSDGQVRRYLGPPDRLGEPAEWHLVEVGDAKWSLAHQMISGSRETVTHALRERCRAIAVQEAPALGAASENELQFLRTIAGKEPVEEEEGRWALYEFPGPLPMVVATGPDARPAPANGPDAIGSASDRVVAWSMGVPGGRDLWTLFVCTPSRWAVCEPSVSYEGSLPPYSRRLLCLSVSGGGAVLSFRGPHQVEEWQAFFLGWLERNGGRVVEAWRLSGATWHLRGVVGPGREETMVDVRFGPDEYGGLRGLLICTPSLSNTEGTPS